MQPKRTILILLSNGKNGQFLSRPFREMGSAKAITQHLDDVSGKDSVGQEEFFKNIGHHDKQEEDWPGGYS